MKITQNSVQVQMNEQELKTLKRMTKVAIDKTHSELVLANKLERSPRVIAGLTLDLKEYITIYDMLTGEKYDFKNKQKEYEDRYCDVTPKAKCSVTRDKTLPF